MVFFLFSEKDTTLIKLYIQPHSYDSLKRMPLLNLPRVWNLEGNEKLNPVQHRFLKYVKKRANLT
jgi:hypothetical protein